MADNKDITIKAQRRDKSGKNESRRLRREGFVPLTIYGGEGDTVSAAAPLRELAAMLRSNAGANTIFTLDIEDAESSEVMFLDRQIDPLRGRLIHADLRRLVRGQEIEVTVPVHLEGEAYGVKTEEGVLDQVLREVQIRCRPRNIPDEILIDVTDLKLNEVLHVSDIPKHQDYEILDDPEGVVATIKFISEEALELPEPGEAPEAEAAEPEVIGKGKDDEE